jgi:dTDP-4-amino-4,6-dideoxygalactose transaminase
MNSKIRHKQIPFNTPHLTGKELVYIQDAHARRQLSGDGFYTKQCRTWMERKFGCDMSLLTHSCTAAIEMMAILADIQPGDEVIIPDYTFVTTANSFVLRHGVPVFIDIRPDTLNIDENLIEAAITKRTKAIVAMHYAGIGCEMDMISAIAKKHKLLVLEDSAQGFLSTYKKRYLGTIGDLAAFSFHETKNIISGEGGALFVNTPRFIERAQIIREKGTNRIKFFEGKIDKYTWVDIGSSYLPGEIVAAFLFAQLQKAVEINKKRMNIWDRYHHAFLDLENTNKLRRPIIPSYVKHNAHLYYILTRNSNERKSLIEHLKNDGILAVTHYVPLHSSPAGRMYSRHVGDMKVSRDTENRLIRLPLYYDLTLNEQSRVIESIHDFYKNI